MPDTNKSPDTGMCRTASWTMRTAGHCRPGACKTWTCTISNTMVFKELKSFSLYFFNLYCIAYCTRPRFRGPGTKPGMRCWTAGRAPGRPLSLIHISEPTRPRLISYAVFCLKKKTQTLLFGRSKMCNTMAATSKQNEIHPEWNLSCRHAASSP